MNIMGDIDMEDSPSPRPHSSSSNRRTNKPLVEKRRRARINSCLSQLKSLVLQAMKQDSAQFSRLEKADILEMTVKYLRHLQRQQVSVVMATNPEVAAKYRAGFSECANEVMRYLGPGSGISHDVRARLNDHLSGRLTGTRGPSPTPQPLNPSPQPVHLTSAHPAPVSPPREEATLATPSPPAVAPHSTSPTASPQGLPSHSTPSAQEACLMQPLQIQIPERGASLHPDKAPTPHQGLLLMPILPVQSAPRGLAVQSSGVITSGPSLAPKPARSSPQASEQPSHSKVAFVAPRPPPAKVSTPPTSTPLSTPTRIMVNPAPTPGVLRRPVAVSHPTPIKLSPPPAHSGLEKLGEGPTKVYPHFQPLLCSPQHCSLREEKLWRPW